MTQKLEKRSNLTPLLIPIQGNPWNEPGMNDNGFNIWALLGIKRMYDLYEGGTMLSFEQIHLKYKLPRCHFFRYLQVRDFTTKKPTYHINAEISQLEKILLQCPTRKAITCFYNVLSQNDVLISQSVAQTWQRELGVSIDEDKWEVTWNRTKKISVCNRARLLQFKILHRLQISPSKRHKMNPQTSPMCLKCKTSVGTFTHCVWLCPKIQTYWLDILQDMEKIFNTVLDMNPLSLLLGYPSQEAFV